MGPDLAALVPRLWRQASAPWRALPDFLIIGAQKSGTSTLFHNLLQHPDALAPSRKELRFFSQGNAVNPAGYRAHFPFRRGAGQVTGEATPEYLLHPATPARVRALLPQVRLIAILRDPVDRAYSHYHHNVRRGHEDLTFAAALDAEPGRIGAAWAEICKQPARWSEDLSRYSYQLRGCYADRLDPWFAQFPREQFLLIQAEDYYQDPAASTARVWAFLGLPPAVLPEVIVKKHMRPYDPIAPADRERLAAYFRPHNARLLRETGIGRGWDV